MARTSRCAAPVPLAIVALAACATGVLQQHDNSLHCSAAGTEHVGILGCHSSRADAPPLANVQLQSATKVLRELSTDGATSQADAPALSFASISARRVSQTARLRSAAGQVRSAAERMHSTWESSVSEIDNLLSGFGNQMAASEDSCSTQLLSYKHSLNQIHTDITTIAYEVNNTQAGVAVYEEECREKNTELMQLESATHVKETTCVTERSVEKKTLEVLKVDLTEMQHIAKSRVTLSSSISSGSFGASGSYPGTGGSSSYDSHGGSGSHGGAGGSSSYGAAGSSDYSPLLGSSITSSSSSSGAYGSGGSATYSGVGGASSYSGGASSYGGAASSVGGGRVSGGSYSSGGVGGSPNGGAWNLGTSSSNPYSLLEAQGTAQATQPAADGMEPPSQERVASVQSMVQQTKSVAAKVATCMNGADDVAPIDASLIAIREEANQTGSFRGQSPPPPGSCGRDQVMPSCHPITCTELGWVCGELPQCAGGAPRCHPLSCVDGNWQCGAVTDPAYEVCHDKSFGEACTYSKGSGYCKSGLFGQGSKCSIPEVPTACKEVVVELEHSFTVSYISLTRLIEEYEVVTHSTVCEETVRQEYTKLSSTLQQEADVACTHVQKDIADLQKFKMQYQSTFETQTQLEKSIEVLVDQCGSLSETESDLENVKTTIMALGNCPGLAEVGFQIPTWTGDWVQWKQERWESDVSNDAAMLAACQATFGSGNGVRAAEVSEIDSQTIQNMPTKNTAPVPLVGACPLCQGDDNGGVSQTGRGRICWDAGVVLGRDTRRGDCAGGLRSALCVYDHGVLPKPRPPRPYSPQPFPQPSGHWSR